jgi:hypothetical protein
MRGKRLRDLSPRDIDRMREVSDAAALEEGRCGVCGSSVRWDLEVLVDCLAPPSEG